MKTAEEWANEIRYGHNTGGIDNTVRAIQLDAMKEGMRRAATIVKDSNVVMDKYFEYKRNSILSASEQLTEKDL